MSLKESLRKGAAELFPGYFALVMATGIISIAAYLLGIVWLGWVLFYINIVFFVILWLLTIIRLIRYSTRLLADLKDYARGPGFFTLIAGTSILGNQFVILAKNLTASIFLWIFVTILWFTLIYAFFTAVTTHEHKPDLEHGIHGGWLVIVVATQSVSILGTLIAYKFGIWQEPLLFFAFSLFLLGCMLYIVLISLIFYRLVFFHLAPEALTPPYWVNMGAVAITTLAGARLILTAPQWGFLQETLPFIKGFTLFFWSTATWWLILLLILGVWLHLYRRFPLRYNPQYWSMVFPLGMYTTSTLVFAQATKLSFLELVPRYFFYAALLAWIITSWGLIRTIKRIFTSR
ncbi:MAG: tellurite resistance/C4-dicarboxylate transporter family protein [Chloroflexi bacterium]|nr:tellurite resistance/C4-dicarboxylate transporter family protein [Chloroflexota bacterium]